MINKPRIIDSTGAVVRSVDPINVSLDLQLAPLSSAEIDLHHGDSIPARSWVAVYNAYGLAGVFRSKPQRERYGNRSSRVSLVHGATELNDWLTGKTAQTEAAANAAISAIFASYSGSMWTLGTVSPTSTIVYDTNYDGVLDAILNVMEQLPGYMLTFDQSVIPWVMNVVARPQTVTAEGRLSRNVESTEITYDDTNLCTKVYIEGVNSGIGDVTAQQKYGVIEHRMSESGYTAAQAQRIAQNYLDAHKEPKLSVSISAMDLSQITGETMDQITLGSKYRLTIPEDEVVIEAIVCGVRYDDVFQGNPQITLASDPESVINYLKPRRGASGSSAKKIDDELKRFETQFVKTDEKISLIATETDIEAAQTLNKSLFEISASKIASLVATTGATDAYPTFDPNKTGGYASGDRVVYNGIAYQFTAAHTGAWTGTDVTAVTTQQSRITQNSGNIETLVTKTGINSVGAGTNLYSMISQDAEKIALVVTSTSSGGTTTNSVNTASIIAAINGGTGHSQIAIEADKVLIDGSTTLGGAFTVVNGHLIASELGVGSVENGIISIGNNKVASNGYDVNINGSVNFLIDASHQYSLTAAALGTMISSATLNNETNTLTLNFFNGNHLDFSKSTSSLIGGTWSGSTLTVAADPNGSSTYTVQHSQYFFGNAGTTFSVKMQAQGTGESTPVERGAIAGYLTATSYSSTKSATAKVVVGEDSTGASFVGSVPLYLKIDDDYAYISKTNSTPSGINDSNVIAYIANPGLYAQGWADCYDTVAIDPSSNRTISPGSSVTVYAKAKRNSTDSGLTSVAHITVTASSGGGGTLTGWMDASFIYGTQAYNGATGLANDPGSGHTSYTYNGTVYIPESGSGSTVNIRSGPGTSYGLVGQVPAYKYSVNPSGTAIKCAYPPAQYGGYQYKWMPVQYTS